MLSSVARRHAITVGLLVAVAAGCSSGDGGTNLNVREPETAATSPEVTTAPAGVVSEAGTSVDSITFDADSRTVAALTGDRTTLLLQSASGADSPPRTITLPEAGNSVTAGRDGAVLVTTNSGVLQVDCASGAVQDITVDGGALSAAPFEDGLAVGNASGEIHILDSSGAITKTIGGLASVDALSSIDGQLTALDTKQTSVTSIDADGGALGPALRAGEGATNLASSPDGRIAVTDTADGELLLFTDDDLILRQRFPVAGSPFAVAFDTTSGVIWVTSTSTNEVVGYDVSTGLGVETARFPTVRQPDSLAVDSQSGDLFVGSSDGQGIQRIQSRSE
jgi:WD40 repeat protein